MIINDDINLKHWMQLNFTSHVGLRTQHKLLEHFGSIANIYAQDSGTLAQIIGSELAKLIVSNSSHDVVNQAINWCNLSVNNHIISIDSPDYPQELLHLSDPPTILFLLGNRKLLSNKKFAIVGSRHPSIYGMQNAESFAYDLAKSGLTVVSGLALGVDAHAHTGAIKCKDSTIGVIGTGIDIVYPKTNSDLYDKIIDNGGLIISEFTLGSPPRPGNFPLRNRIIAALSIGVLVIESNLDGGSMITANLALELGREVMALPGSINSQLSRGCHKLIKSGALLVENVHDILNSIGHNTTLLVHDVDKGDAPSGILAFIGYEPVTLDNICKEFNYQLSEACTLMLELELRGDVINCGNGKYQRSLKATSI